MDQAKGTTKQEEPNWKGYSDASLKPGYPTAPSTDKASYGAVDDEDLKRGFQKP